MSVPRGNRMPPVAAVGAVNVLAIGDVHLSDTAWVTSPRLARCAEDISRMAGRGALDAVVQVGDHTSVASTAEFNAYLAWKATVSLPAGVPFEEIPGNHDLTGGNSPPTADVVTTAQWAAIMSRAGGVKDMVVDLGDRVRLLLLAPTSDSTGTLSTGVGFTAATRTYLDATDLAWCDARMDEVPDRQCVIFFHAPLFQTQGPLDGSAFSSYDTAGRWVAHAGTSTIAAMIARHPNFVAWVAGHSHTLTTEVDAVKAKTYGTVTFAAVAACSPSSANPDLGRQNNRIATCLLTVLPDRVEVRYRDNGVGQWLSPVHTVTP